MNMERDIKGMEELHWKVVYMERELEELKKALEAPNPNIYVQKYFTLSPSLRQTLLSVTSTPCSRDAMGMAPVGDISMCRFETLSTLPMST